LRASGLNGCFSYDSIYLPVDTIRPVVETFPDTITCRNPRPFLDFTTNINNPAILWTTDFGYSSKNLRSRTDTNGIYTIEVKGKNGCSGTATLEIISNNDPPNVFLDSITYLLCDSTTVPLDLQTTDNNLSFQWFFNGNTFIGDMQNPNADSIGSYTVYVNGQNGCGVSRSTETIIDTRLPEFTTFTDIITCEKEIVTIGANIQSNDVVWEWIGPNGFTSTDTTFQTSLDGQYFLSMIRSNRCTDTVTVMVPIDTILPNVIIDQNQSIQCEVRIIELDGSNSNSEHGASYFWSTNNGEILSGINNPIVTIRDPGNYQLKLVDNFNGCKDSMLVTIVETDQEFMDFTLDVNNPFCAGYGNGEILVTSFIGGNGPYKISLDGEFFAEKDGISFLEPGTYLVSVQDSFGCIISKEAIVEEPRPIFLNLGRDTLLRFGDSVTIFGTATIPSTDIASIVWSPPNGLSCTDCLVPVARPSRTTRYVATIYDENGCEATNEIIIRINEEPDIAIPTIFRPSSDNGNDVFYLPQTRGVLQVNSFSIYDRWGNRMYHAENFFPGDKQNGWDGRFQGQQVQPAVFTVITDLTLINSEKVTIVSDVTLLR
jgi:gliding motility-associated-like protein